MSTLPPDLPEGTEPGPLDRLEPAQRPEPLKAAKRCTCGHRRSAHFATGSACSSCVGCSGYTPKRADR